MRSAHETLDPEEIGELIVTSAAQWLRASALAVYAVDMDGQVGLMAVARHDRRRCRRRPPP